MEEIGCEAIWFGRFAIFKLGHSVLHFLHRDWLEKHFFMVLRDDLWNMMCDRTYSLIFVAQRLLKNVLKVLFEFLFHFFMHLQMLSLPIINEGNIIVHSPLNSRLVNFFCIFLPILKPFDPRFFVLQGLFLLPSFFNFVQEGLLLLCIVFCSSLSDNALLQCIHLLLQYFLMVKNITKLRAVPRFENLFEVF